VLVLLAGRERRPNGAGPDGGDPAGTDAATPDAPAVRCSTYVREYNGHKYRLVEGGIPWAQAKSSCEADGGYLLKIETGAEDDQVERAFLFGPMEVWMGLSDLDNDGNYQWTDGTALASFTNWFGGGPPNAGSPDCIVKNTYETDGRWYPRNCSDNKSVICECNP
jgi:hypothetical protein